MPLNEFQGNCCGMGVITFTNFCVDVYELWALEIAARYKRIAVMYNFEKIREDSRLCAPIIPTTNIISVQ